MHSEIAIFLIHPYDTLARMVILAHPRRSDGIYLIAVFHASKALSPKVLGLINNIGQSRCLNKPHQVLGQKQTFKTSEKETSKADEAFHRAALHLVSHLQRVGRIP